MLSKPSPDASTVIVPPEIIICSLTLSSSLAAFMPSSLAVM